jgi:hypothetical protein
VIITPVRDNIIDPDDDITFTLLSPGLGGNDYTIGSDTKMEAIIADDVAEVTLTLNDGEAAEAGQDPASFTVTRTSNGNPAVRIRIYVERGGTAGIGADYTTQNLIGVDGTTYYINIEANEMSKTVIITPVFEQIEEDDETVIFTLLGPGLGGNDYTLGSPSQFEAIILDFRDLVFSDSFETKLE